MQTLSENHLLQNGKFRILRVLGQGGFGITYLAVHTLLDRQVAIKEFFPKDFCDRNSTTSHVTLGTANTAELVTRLRKKFMKEAVNVSKLQHPNIVTIHDIFEENNTAYYIMDYIEGLSLGDMLRQTGAMTETKALKYIRPIASALDYIHSKSINHLDIKPANVMVRSSDDTPVLIDFGLSKQYDSSGNQTSTTPVGISHGYAPVEQYKPGGVSSFTPQTDIYALGATLFALLTGEKPPHYSEIIEDGLPSLPPYVSASTIRTVEHAMEIRKNNRQQSIAEFLADLNVPSDTSPLTENTDSEETVIAEVVSRPALTPTPTVKPAVKESKPISHEGNLGSIVIDEVEFVDLGLSVKWANCNLGATKPTDSGLFVNRYDWSTTGEVYHWNLKGALVPTIEHFKELITNCNWEWTEQNDTEGYMVTGRGGNRIFLPFSGDSNNSMFKRFGRLFTREAINDATEYGKYLFYFSHSDYKLVRYDNEYVCPVRLILP